MTDASTPRDRLNAAKSPVGDEIEALIWSGRYSLKTMVGTWATAGLATIALPIALAVSPISGLSVAWTVLLGLQAIAWVWLIGVALIRKFGDQYELTNQRLKHRHGILFRKANRIELIDIDDVMYSQGPIQAILGVGAITIESSDTTHPQLQLVGIDEVGRITDLIDDARRAERLKRGLHIEAI